MCSSSSALPARGPSRALPGWLRLLPWILFALFALRDLELPGLYMDEINHGAFVPAMLHAEAADKPHFRLPDNILGDQHRYPILGGSVYNVVVKAYLAAPLYEFWGYTVLTHRLFELLVGALMLYLFSVLARRLFGPRIAIALTAALAIDPLLTFQLRSQAFSFALMLVPILGFLIVLQDSWCHRRVTSAGAILAGFCTALAAMCYFVGGPMLLVPWLVLAWLAWESRRFWLLVLSTLVGLGPYIYSLISVHLQAPAVFVHWGMPAYAVSAQQRNHASLLERLAGGGREFFEYLATTHALAFTGVGDVPWGQAKAWLFTALLTGMVAVVILRATREVVARREAAIHAIIILCPLVSFGALLCALASINTHYLLSTLPFVYLALGCVAEGVTAWFTSRNLARWGEILALVLPCALAVGSVRQQQTVIDALESHGGRGLFNERISALPQLKAQLFPKSHLVFADWGMHLPFLYLTAGRVPYSVHLSGNPAKWLPADLKARQDLVICAFPEHADSLAAFGRQQGAVAEITPVTARDGSVIYSLLHLTSAAAPPAAP